MSIISRVGRKVVMNITKEQYEARMQSKSKTDQPHDPDHYKGAVECIDAIRESMTAEAFAGYLKGNVQKYLWRYEKKGGVEDLRKANVYLNWLIEHEDTRNNERDERGKLPPPICPTP